MNEIPEKALIRAHTIIIRT